MTFHITYICNDLLCALSNCQAVKVSMWKTDSIHWVCQFVEWFVDSDDGMMPIWWSWHYGADRMMLICWSWHYGADMMMLILWCWYVGADMVMLIGWGWYDDDEAYMMMLIWCRVSNSFPSTAADSMGTHLATLPHWDSVTTKPVWLLCFLFLVMNKYLNIWHHGTTLLQSQPSQSDKTLLNCSHNVACFEHKYIFIDWSWSLKLSPWHYVRFVASSWKNVVFTIKANM